MTTRPSESALLGRERPSHRLSTKGHNGVDRYQRSARRVCVGETKWRWNRSRAILERQASPLRGLPGALLLIPLHLGLLLSVVLLLALGLVLLAAFVAHVAVLLAVIMTRGGGL